MNAEQINSITEQKDRDSSLQGATNQTGGAFLQTFIHIYRWLCSWSCVVVGYASLPFFVYSCISPSLRIFALIYILWMYYDRRTQHTGGRRWLWARKMNFWRLRRDYFPIKLVKTAELPPDTTYLFAAFPHGIWPYGTSTNFCSDLTGFDKAFPGLTAYVHGANFIFNIPIFRELYMALGISAVSRESILHVLNGPPGNVSVVLVGGYQELLRSSPETNRIVLKNRKGFVRLALKAGSSLVPVFNFGETSVYDQIKWYQRLQEKLHCFFQSAGLPIGKGPCRLDYLFGLLPHQRPITTVVGSPIKLSKVQDPSDELVDKFHEIFVREMTALFEKHKAKYDPRGENATLSIE